MATPLIMIVDDRPADQLAVASIVREEDCQVLFAEEFKQALAAFRSDVDVVICRAEIAGTGGVEFMGQWLARRSDASFFFLVDRDNSRAGRQAMKAGASGYLHEPIDFDELRAWIRQSRTQHAKTQRLRELQLRLDKRLGFETLIGQSNAMRLVVEQARAAAESTSGALISGEPGTGKSLVAELIHQNSRRRSGPFVTFQVRGFSVRQVEQELFGFFNGGMAPLGGARIGRLDEAVGGSLFINDIADLAAVTQARLLRAFERRLPGGPPAGAIDVRSIVATKRKLDALAAEGRFSSALYRRLSGINLRLPPLRERREDIPLLFNHFLQQACDVERRPVPSLEAELIRFIERFDWPGNVRQLRDCVESMLAMNKSDSLSFNDLPARIDDPAEPGAGMYFPAGMSLAELERSAVEQALTHCDGNRTRAADRLGISVRTLQRKLKSWSLEGLETEPAFREVN